MVKTVILDLWNTLLINPKLHPIEEILKVSKLPIEHHILLQRCDEMGLFTRTVNSLTIWTEIMQSFNKGEFAKQANDIWLRSSHKTAFFPKTNHFLKELKSKYRVGLASSINKESFEILDAQFNLSKIFDFVAPTYEFKLNKNSQFYKKICKEYHCDPTQTVMIGDSVYYDIIPANNAGLKTIILNRFQLEEQELQDVPKNTPICQSYDQTLSVLQLSEVSL